jgi:hypothetical protein
MQKCAFNSKNAEKCQKIPNAGKCRKIPLMQKNSMFSKKIHYE